MKLKTKGMWLMTHGDRTAQARVQELLGGGGKYFNHKWTVRRAELGGSGACSPGKIFKIEWFSCILVHIKVLIQGCNKLLIILYTIGLFY